MNLSCTGLCRWEPFGHQIDAWSHLASRLKKTKNTTTNPPPKNKAKNHLVEIILSLIFGYLEHISVPSFLFNYMLVVPTLWRVLITLPSFSLKKLLLFYSYSHLLTSFPWLPSFLWAAFIFISVICWLEPQVVFPKEF